MTASKAFKKTIEHLNEHPKAWLVTGAGGFIGSNLVEFLLSNNQKVVGLDNFATGYVHNIDDALAMATSTSALSKREIKANFKFHEGDIRNIDDCIKALDLAENSFNENNSSIFVLHQAALGSVPRSIEDPVISNDVNITGFLNMLIAASNAKVLRFVYAASSSTYGDHPSLPKVESVIGNPLSPYAVTKYANELYAKVFSDIFELETVGIRYFNVFGKRQDPHGSYAAVIPRWIGKIKKGQEIVVHGDGSNSRDFTYIENIVQMNILAAVCKKEISGEIFNGAFGQQTSLSELIDVIRKSFSRRNIDIGNLEICYGKPRPGDVHHSLADIIKAKLVLGYEPTHSVEQGMYETVSWFSER